MSTSGYPPTLPAGEAGAVRIRRFVNDEIARFAGSFQALTTSGFEFVCECGDLRCKGIVNMSLAEYAKTTPGSVVGHAGLKAPSRRSRRELAAETLDQRYLVAEAVADAPYVVLVADEQMRFAAASEAACEVLGYDRDALLKLSVPDIIFERHEAPALYRDFVAAGEQRGRITLRARNGQLIDAMYSAHETTMSNLPYFVSVLFPLGAEATARHA